MHPNKTNSSALNAKVANFIKDARSKLIDSGTRNRLVHVNRKGRGRFLNIVNERSDDIFRILYIENKRMKFRATELPTETEEDGEVHFGDVDLGIHINKKEIDESGFTDKNLDINLDSDALQKKLLMMARDAKTAEEEQGINILFLALGFLAWYEDDKSNVQRESPLILIPVELVRNERTSTYDLCAREEDILTNLSLQARLQEDFGIALPEIEVDDNWSPSIYFEKIDDISSTRQRWKIDCNGIQLGFFSFAKQLMLRDLEQNEWPIDRLGNDKLIQEILVEGFKQQEPLFGADESLDDRLVPEDIIQVVDADSPQTKVIEEVRAGRHLVVQGPPGTGKSQTITNIIAAAVHDGKSVLFMAEKMAALDVVHNRLKKCQLGNLCLELHSRHANKREVLEEIGRTLHSSKETGAFVFTAESLKEKRNRLNRIVDLLHDQIPNMSFSAYQTMAEVIGFVGKGYRPPQITCKGLEKLDKQQQKEIEELIRIVADEYSRWNSRAEHPFIGVRNLGMDPIDQERMLGVLEIAIDCINQFTNVASDLLQDTFSGENRTSGHEFEERTIESLADMRRYEDFFELLGKRPAEVPSVRECIFGNTAADTIVKALEIGADWSKEKQKASFAFNDEAWDVSTKPLIKTFTRGAQGGLRSFIARLSIEYFNARTTLSAITLSPLPKNPAECLQLLKQLQEIEKKRRKLKQHSKFLKKHLPITYDGERTRFTELRDAAQWVLEIEKSRVLHSVKELERAEELVSNLDSPKKDIRKLCSVVFDSTRKAVNQLELDLEELTPDSDINLLNLKKLCSKFQTILEEGSAGYLNYCELNSAEAKLEEYGLSELMTLIDSKSLDSKSSIIEFRYACAEARWNYTKSVLPELVQLLPANRHNLVQAFMSLDNEHSKNVQSLIRTRHQENIPKGAAGQMGIIRGEIGKRRKHIPIRKLMSGAGNMIQRIKPVFLMSPISIAQFLPPKSLRFDLLVIDEASQVRPEDAIGAIARCNQIVVVGDQKQLPPTSFFDRLESDSTSEDEDDDEIGIAKVSEMESILTLCEARGVNQKMLEWHYRSRDPSLIRVSNERFYERKLILPPSPEAGKEVCGMFFTKVPGIYSSRSQGVGRSGTNLIEAEFVAKEVAKHARNKPTLSLGIVTFSKSQADMVTEILERDRRVDVVLNQFLREGRNEDCFVKNIENVQGDERDVIFISVGYGPTEAGKKLSSMNFGPINKEGGERRLNVLFTRARHRCQVFASFEPEDIHPKGLKWPGVEILQQYMRFAKTRQLDNIAHTEGTADSPFEEDVADVVRSQGFIADHQVGESGFRIDLGIRHPDTPNQYILAIECDGATYHSALSARERDRHRQTVLEQMGWKFHRIWSTDWFYRRVVEVKRLKSALEEAKTTSMQNSFSGANHNNRLQSDLIKSGVSGKSEYSYEDLSTTSQIRVPKYVEAKVYVGNIGDPHEVPIPELSKLAKQVVEQEGPIHIDVIARRVAEAFRKGRVGSRIHRSVLSALSSQDDVVSDRNGFWFTQAQRKNPTIRNREGITGIVTKAEMLPPIEISAAARLIKNESGHVEKDELIREVSQLLGFKRTGSDLKRLIGKVIDQNSDYEITPMQHARGFRDTDTIEHLSDVESDTNIYDGYEDSPLQLAVKDGDDKAVRALIDSGAGVNIRDKYGDTLLHNAVEHGNIEIVTILIDAGADVNAQGEYGRTLLKNSVENDNIEAVSILIDAGADVNARDKFGDTVLHNAVGNGNIEMLRALVVGGADMSLRNKIGWRPLYCAAQDGEIEAVSVLIDAGADLCVHDENGDSLLHAAVRDDNTEIVHKLVESSEIIDLTNKDGNSPLHDAVYDGKIEIVRALVEGGADLDLKNKQGDTPLHLAAKKFDAKSVVVLIESGADLNARNKFGDTPLCVAGLDGENEAARALRDAGAEVNEREGFEDMSLHHAAIYGRVETVRTLCDAGANVNERDDLRGTPLHSAVVIRGHAETVRVLIEAGADVNVKDEFGDAPLHVAARDGQFEVARILIEAGADVNAEDEFGDVPLRDSVRHGHAETVQVLIEAGADVNAEDVFGDSPLRIAARRGCAESVQMLVDAGADVNAKDEFGDVPLRYAAGRGHAKTVRILIEAGADVNAKDEFGVTPLHDAALYGAAGGNHAETVRTLIESGADVNARNRSGGTPLHNASSFGHDEVVRILVEAGAHVNVANNSGTMPLQYAEQGGHNKIVLTLLRAGAKKSAT